MLSTSFFNSQLTLPLSDTFTVSPETSVIDALEKASSNDIDYLLYTKASEILGVIPLKSILKKVRNLEKLQLADFVETDFSIIDRTELTQSSGDNSLKYLIVREKDQLCGLVDLAAFSHRDRHILDNTLSIVDAILNSSHNGIIAVDEQRNIIAINQSAMEIYSLGDDVIDCPLAEVIPGSPLMPFIFQDEPQINHKYSMDGKVIIANRTFMKLHDRTLGAISVFQDVTDNENAWQELAFVKENEKNLESFIENSYDGIYITDRNGKTLKVNQAYERMTGTSKEDLIGRYMKDLVKDGVLSIYITDEVVRQKRPVTINQTAQNKKELVITGSPIFDEKGEVERVITNVRDITELVSLQKQLFLSQMASSLYQEELFREISAENIVCDSKSFKEAMRLSKKVSSKDSTVLILGETGVGKEVIARYIHMNSPRKNNNYIKINCGAIPANLLESELFGYAPGAFTNANPKGKIGMFELANEGTLFLDEIGEMPLDLQSSLLRVLQDGEVTRVGDTRSKKVNVRIIAATNRDLVDMIRQGTFRTDLFYRLNVVSITIPPLRERTDDIPGLAEHFIGRLNEKYKENKIITSGFISQLMEMQWPGNVREMGNFIEKQFVMSDDDIIDGFLVGYQTEKREEGTQAKARVTVEGLMPINTAVKEVESILIKRAMKKGQTTYKAAKLLEISQPTFFRKYKEYCKNDEAEGELTE